jgi:hypothetical protein
MGSSHAGTLMRFLVETTRCDLGDLYQTNPVGSGGAGVVFLHPSLPNQCIKIYKRDRATGRLVDHAAGHEAKVRAMLANPPDVVIGNDGTVQMAWPQAAVIDTSGVFRGFVMPYIDFNASWGMNQVLQPKLRKAKGIPDELVYRLTAAVNLSFLMMSLHKAGHYIIDVKPQNMRVYGKPASRAGFVALLDCDGFYISDGAGGTAYPATLATPEFAHPNGITTDGGADLAWMNQNPREQDLWSLSVLTFLLLNEIHPLQGIPRNFPDYPSELPILAKRHNEVYAYGIRANPLVDPKHGSLHEWFSADLRSLFDRTFGGTYTIPPAREWQRALYRLSQPDHRCPRNPEHWKLGDVCGKCEVESGTGTSSVPGGQVSTPVNQRKPLGPIPSPQPSLQVPPTHVGKPASVQPQPVLQAPLFAKAQSLLVQSASATSRPAPWIGRVLLVAAGLVALYVLASVRGGRETLDPVIMPEASTAYSGGEVNSDDSSETSENSVIDKLLSAVGAFAEVEIDKVLTVARAGSKAEIETAAINAGRGFDFEPFQVAQDASYASRLNAQALNEFNANADVAKAYELQVDAFRANPFNAEVAGNLAIYALKLGYLDKARSAVSLALSLPRPSDKAGRTSDWMTLAALYAKNGDTDAATEALYVTLAVVMDVGKRCYSAIHSTMFVYGDELRSATERMLERVHAQQLSYAPACRLPVDWSLAPSQVKFERSSKLTINGMDPIRLGTVDDQFTSIFGRRLSSLTCVPGPSDKLRECGIQENFLGDVKGMLFIERSEGSEDQIVGIAIDDPVVATPSGVAVGLDVEDMRRAYGSRFQLEAVSDDMVRLRGFGRDAGFELRFRIRDQRVTRLETLVSSAYIDGAPVGVGADSPEGVALASMPELSSVSLSVGVPFEKTMDGNPYTSPRLSIPEGSRAEDYTFMIRPSKGIVKVNVTAERGVFTYLKPGTGDATCRFGPWTAVEITNVSAESVKVTLKKRKSLCR